MTILIRPATRDDVPRILAIYNDAVLNTTASWDYEPSTLDARLAWYDEQVECNFPIFVADDAGEIVGWSAFGKFRAKIGYQFSVENSVYVAADRRGQGIGKLLMPPLIETAQAQRRHVIIAGVEASNEVSIRLHAHFGFVECARFRQVGYKFGRWLDLVFMQRILEPQA
jgi:phosphinothricin acetyltransferase